MKQYDVTLTGHFEKTVSIYADSPEQAEEKLKIILFDTDLIQFSDKDFVCDYYHAWEPPFSNLRATEICCIITLESHHYI